MPYTHVSTLDGLQHDTLPALNINISTDNHLDRVIEGFLSEGHNLSRSSSAVPDLATSSVPFGTGPDPDPISKCLQDLAELNGTLLHSRANRRGTGHSDLSQPQSISTRAGSSVPPSIGHTLRHCQNFLTTIQHLQQRVNSDSGDDTWSPTRPEDGIAQQQCTNHSAAFGRSILLSCSPFSHVTPYILEEYERLFSSILQSVTQSVPHIPATLIGTSLDGFKLDGNNILQMELLLYVSSNLLGKIEAILLGSTEGTTTESNQGLLGCKMAGCLESLYDHNGLPSGDGAGKREVRARTLIRKVQAALKTIEK
ncbi:hypothetical protein N7519_004801 [Penicillium mononematosum]|uniref:uncharacterized protein n=1 Tax=Penicillium mononematosum TaxID=268346 RepID=UPI002547D830|nr:uncharacterized protein N7519_004801 [Penicillium mononematosum]KAJ6189893.1 hypothetical protein N7519_004801 [Penicillium mononematosum]